MAVGDDGNTASQIDLSGGQKFMKYVIVFINVLFLIFGIVLIALGSAALKDLAGKLSGNTLPEGIIAMGVFILLTSLLGFFSAWKEWRIGLGIYFVIVLILAIILISVGVAIYALKDDADAWMTKGWNAAGIDVRISLMLAFNCCGLQSKKEYNDDCANGKVNMTRLYPDFVPPSNNYVPPSTPSSCCDGNKALDAAVTCLPKMSSGFKSAFVPAGSAGIAFAVLMIVALFFIGLLMKGIRIKNVTQQIAKNRERTEKERAAQKRGIQLPDNVL